MTCDMEQLLNGFTSQVGQPYIQSKQYLAWPKQLLRDRAALEPAGQVDEEVEDTEANSCRCGSKRVKLISFLRETYSTICSCCTNRKAAEEGVLFSWTGHRARYLLAPYDAADSRSWVSCRRIETWRGLI